MVMGSSKKGKNNFFLTNITLFNTKITYVDKYKYLGLMLNERLSLTHHANTLLGQVVTKLKTLINVRKYVNCQTSLLIYKTMVYHCSITPILHFHCFL